jgi:hypothetical protein
VTAVAIPIPVLVPVISAIATHSSSSRVRGHSARLNFDDNAHALT